MSLGIGITLALDLVPAQAAREVAYLIVEDKARPFQVVENGESRGGIVSDMVDAIFAGSRYEVDHQVYPINRLRQVVAEDQIEYWVAYEAVHWQTFGNHGLLVDEPLFTTHHVMLSCREELPDRITTLDQLRDLSLVTLRYFDYQPLDEAVAEGFIKEIPIDRYEAGIQLVGLGRADGFVEMESRLRFHVRRMEHAFDECMRWIDFSAIIPDFPIYLSVDIDWPPEFREFVARRIRELRSSGAFDRIIENYLGDGIAD
ncbi:hypothetical protein J057_03075 [Marinobacter nanhaiticus D15-8W]|uniref:Amino acid ABC transporter substrate-binding protein n=1 Tax=Marinobacter nanhaiticus D15-8W TaxID=626887 RepID=N6W290_9GAMM|nr:ABC transporter substrate-binding protein [Marinobacter nanhaiticus]ENO16655.1 hypothetical protein J057_03075 [Marinobacter nanhaiticus D15-8W]